MAASPSAHCNVGSLVPEQARQGRSRQRYDGSSGDRLVAGCIPVRYAGTAPKPEDVQIMMISSRNGKGWVFPKGGWENDESVEAAAMRETVEEAGVRGRLEEPMIGTFRFASAKHVQYRCCAHMFALHVAEELDMWPERERERCWVSLPEASRRCRHPWMREALHTWMRRNGWGALVPDQVPNGSGGAERADLLVAGDSFDSSSSSGGC